MRWQNRSGSKNIIDLRSGGGKAKAGGISLVGLALVVVVWLLGGDVRQVLSLVTSGGGPTAQVGRSPASGAPGGGSGAAPRDELGRFASVVLADTERTWHGIFERMGKTYREPKLVLFRDGVDSACGFQQSAVGPFYCPGDQRAYVDLGFFDVLSQRLGAPGDFAQAYVLAHEIGHHVQNLLGTSRKVHDAKRRASKVEGNRLSVRQELQADCYAGIWAHHAARQGMLEPGDVEEGLRAASAIGDDRLQGRGGGQVSPESFTHGTSEQRVRWLQQGMESGDLQACDTFSAPAL